jgi:ATP synthase protein I
VEGNEKTQEKPTTLARAFGHAKMSSVGIEMAVCVLLGWGLGHWADGQLGTAPWLTILCFGCGVAAGFKALWRAAREARAQLTDQKGGL